VHMSLLRHALSMSSFSRDSSQSLPEQAPGRKPFTSNAEFYVRLKTTITSSLRGH
jgi:hypothetical protein